MKSLTNPARVRPSQNCWSGDTDAWPSLDAGAPADWVSGDRVYDRHSELRMMLEQRQMPYVLAVPVNQRVIATIDNGAASKVAELRADALATTLQAQAWKISPGADSRGPRVYHWGVAIRLLESDDSYWLLVKRNLTDPDDLAYYLRYDPKCARFAS